MVPAFLDSAGKEVVLALFLCRYGISEPLVWSFGGEGDRWMPDELRSVRGKIRYDRGEDTEDKLSFVG